MNADDWESFKKNEVAIVSDYMSDLEEHTNVTDIIDDKNRERYLITIKDYCKETCEQIKSFFNNPLRVSEFSFGQMDKNAKAIWNFLRDNCSEELIAMVLLGNPNDELTSYNLSNDSADNISITVDDLYRYLFHYWPGMLDIRTIEIFGERKWDMPEVEGKVFRPENPDDKTVIVERIIWD